MSPPHTERDNRVWREENRLEGLAGFLGSETAKRLYHLIFPLDTIGKQFTQLGKILGQSVNTLLEVSDVIAVIEIQKGIRGTGNLGVNFLGNFDNGLTPFLVIRDIAVKLEMCRRGVINKRLTELLHRVCDNRICCKRLVCREIRIERQCFRTGLDQCEKLFA